jgi:hypothetical protein
MYPGRKTHSQCLVVSAALSLLLCNNTAFASQQTGTVALLAVANNDATPKAVSLSGIRTTAPACATDGMWAFKDMSILSVILTAKFNNKPITINGTGACAAQNTTREEIAYITVD